MACLAKHFRHHYSIIFNGKRLLQHNLVSPRYLKTTVFAAGLRSRDRAPTLMEFKKRVDYMKEKGLWPEYCRSSFIEWDSDVEIYAFGRRLGEEFDSTLIREAFIDQSYIVQEKKRLDALGMADSLEIKSNQELAESGRTIAKEFLSKCIRSGWSLLPEEGIECVTDYLISNEVFAKIGLAIGMKDLILTQENPPSVQTCATCFSAVIGALQLSSGLEKTYKFIQDFVLTDLVDKDLWDIWHIDDPMYLLKSILNRSSRGDPEPRLIGDIGKLTLEAVFYVGIYSDKQLFGTGYGQAVDEAVNMAALDSLSRLFDQTLSKAPFPFPHDTTEFVLKSIPNRSLSEWQIN